MLSHWYHFIRSWLCGMKTFNPYPLRIDEELMEELKEMAEAHSRSVNKEIEYLVKEAVKNTDKLKMMISPRKRQVN